MDSTIQPGMNPGNTPQPQGFPWMIIPALISAGAGIFGALNQPKPQTDPLADFKQWRRPNMDIQRRNVADTPMTGSGYVQAGAGLGQSGQQGLDPNIMNMIKMLFGGMPGMGG